MRELGVLYNSNYYAISEHPGYGGRRGSGLDDEDDMPEIEDEIDGEDAMGTGEAIEDHKVQNHQPPSKPMYHHQIFHQQVHAHQQQQHPAYTTISHAQQQQQHVAQHHPQRIVSSSQQHQRAQHQQALPQ
jgi:hypothetical protein